MSPPISLPPLFPPVITNGIIANATVDIAHHGRAVASDLPAKIDPTTKAGIILADGRILTYHGEVAPPLDIPENAFLTVADYPGNDVLVGAILQCVNVRQQGMPVPKTLFDLYRKVQP